MAAVEVYLPAKTGTKFIPGPPGYFQPPQSIVESPLSSGLYAPPSYLSQDSPGVYTVPEDMIGSEFSRRTSNIHSFSVQEDATPIDPSSSFGGVGTITTSIDDSPDIPLMNGGVILADGSRGKTSGIIRGADGNDGIATLTADSTLGLLNTERTLAPVIGTLRDAVQYYCDVVQITNDVVVDPSVANRPVVYPGGKANVWVRVKQMLAAEQLEMALVFNRIYVRPLRLLVADTSRLTTRGWSVSNDRSAKTVEISYYNSVAAVQKEIYPVKGQDPQIIIIDAGQTQVVQQQVNATLTSVNQPVPTYSVGNTTFDNTSGVYSVTGADDLPIQPAQWLAAGGKLTVRVTSDPSVIEIVVRGANLPNLSPFRIAMSSGASTYYNSLHITGQGVAWDRESIVLPTGAVSTTTSEEVGVVVENPYIRTKAQAYSTGLRTAGAYAGLQYTISGNAFALNRTGDGRDLIQATISDFNAEYPVETIADFNSEWSGDRILEFNRYWQNKVDLLWENQLFGNAPGARILGDEANFRIVSATTDETSVQFTGELDTIVSDFSEAHVGDRVSDFNVDFLGYTCKDFSIVPLRRG